MYETTATLVGKVVSEIRQHRFDDGTSLTTFRLGVRERRYDRETAGWSDGGKLYVTVACRRRLAESVAASLGQGDMVVATGRLHQREYESGGLPRSDLELEALAVGPDLARCSATVHRPAAEAAAPVPAFT